MAASEPQAAVDDRGDAVVMWTGRRRSFIQYAFRPRRGAFGAAQDIAPNDAFEPQVAFDESGNALAAWTRFVGRHRADRDGVPAERAERSAPG